MTTRELLEARRSDLADQIVRLTARLAEVEHLLALTGDPRAVVGAPISPAVTPVVTKARNPRSIAKESNQ